MKKTILILMLLTIVALATATAVECGTTPTDGCIFTVSTVINIGDYENKDVSVNASNIVIEGEVGEGTPVFYGGSFVIAEGVTNITLEGFWIQEQNLELIADDLTLNNMYIETYGDINPDNLLFSGDNMVITNTYIRVRDSGGSVAFQGDNVLIDNNWIECIDTSGEDGTCIIGITDPSQGYSAFSGQIINNCIYGQLASDSYSGMINITGNTFGGMDDGDNGGCNAQSDLSNIFLIEDGTGEIYFYGNDLIGTNTPIFDYTDYPTNAITWCVGCQGNTGIDGFFGSDDPLQGTCCPESWSEDEYVCPEEGEYTSLYTDANSCSDYADTYYDGLCDLPLTNGTLQSCVYEAPAWVVGTHTTGDVVGVVIDGVSELGIEYIKYAGLIALIGLTIWAIGLL